MTMTLMRRSAVLTAVTGVALFVISGSSAALAEKPRSPQSKQMTPMPVPFTWTGCYVGANFVAGGQSIDFRSGAISSSVNNWIGGLGGNVGCDYQFASNIVIGAKFEANWLTGSG